MLVEEFTAWSRACPQHGRLISLEEVAEEEGSKMISFRIDSEQTFRLRCPANYPDYEDDNFFVEAPSCLQLWCNALNEYLLDSGGSSFCAILWVVQ